MTHDPKKPTPHTNLKREEFAEMLARLVAAEMAKQNPPQHTCVFTPEMSELLLELAREYKESKESRKIVKGIIQSTAYTVAVTGVLYALWEGVKVLLHK